MIHSKGVIVEMDGDQMTRVIWRLVKDKLILPFVDVKLEYYDLGLENRDRTDDRVTHDAAAAIRRQGVGVKCATITPSIAQVKEFGLKKAWPSPNGTIRGELDGTVFRKPILASNVPVAVRSWRKPIVIGRHAYGDIYKATEIEVRGPGRAEIVFTPIRQAQGESASGEPTRHLVHEFKGPGVVMAMHNTEKSVRSFARACLRYALDEKINIWFSSKDTISKTYHTFFKHVFAEEVAQRKDEMAAAGIAYRYLLIDDAVAQMMKHEGGILWALMNYDGDVQSDMVAAGFGSLGMMTSELVSPDGPVRIRGRARHRRAALRGPPGRETDEHELGRDDLRLVRRAAETRRAGRDAGTLRLRRRPGTRRPGRHRVRRDDPRPGPPGPRDRRPAARKLGHDGGIHLRRRAETRVTAPQHFETARLTRPQVSNYSNGNKSRICPEKYLLTFSDQDLYSCQHFS